MRDALRCIASLVKVSNKFDHISVGFWWYENIWNFKTWELQIIHKWNLAQMCITWTLLIYQIMRVSMNGRVGVQLKKQQKMPWS